MGSLTSLCSEKGFPGSYPEPLFLQPKSIPSYPFPITQLFFFAFQYMCFTPPYCIAFVSGWEICQQYSILSPHLSGLNTLCFLSLDSANLVFLQNLLRMLMFFWRWDPLLKMQHPALYRWYRYNYIKKLLSLSYTLSSIFPQSVVEIFFNEYRELQECFVSLFALRINSRESNV